ncbi:MAG: hypothetical protein ACYC0P_03080 [Thiobacillus sp.]
MSNNVIQFPGETRWLPAPANDDDGGQDEPVEPAGLRAALLYALRVNAGGIVLSAAVCAALWYLRG